MELIEYLPIVFMRQVGLKHLGVNYFIVVVLAAEQKKIISLEVE